MSMNTPIGGITQITPIKNFQEISELDNEQYLLGIKDSNTGSGGKVKFETLISDSISENNDNIITTGTDGKLLVNTPPQIGDLSNLTTTNKSTLVGAINEVDGDVGNLTNLTTSDKTNVVNAINSEVSARGTAETNIQNDYNGKIGTLSNLDTAYKSNLVGAINEIAAIAEPSLQYETMNNSKALETGTPSTDTTILADIQKYAHSTFDRSKFTVVGSPNITDDGIVSGFSSSNQVKVPNTLPTVTTNDKWSIKYKFTLPQSASSNQTIIRFPYGAYGHVQLSSSSQIIYVQPFGSVIREISGSDFVWGATYEIENIFTGTNVIINVKRDGVSLSSQTQELPSTPVTFDLRYLAFGWNNNASDPRAFTGSIDLKQFSITVDGVPVFSGNKTGIDTIKPDNYTVVGTPTISADGIASGFSSGNYITKSITSSSYDIVNKKYEVRFKSMYNLNSGDTNTSQMYFGMNYKIWCYYDVTNFRLDLYGAKEGGGNVLLCRISSLTLSNNDVIEITANVTQGSQSLKCVVNGTEHSATGSVSNMLTEVNSSINIFIGTNTYGYLTSGSIDLNSFKIYVDRDLVYQPCLKIPYTESHSGSKIADAIYRDRVIDAYEQGYDYRYYTLSDTDFMLPMGEIYGDIENCLNVNTATQAEKDVVIGWGAPDYANGISETLSTTEQSYTCPVDGVVVIAGAISNNGSEPALKINDVAVGYGYNAGSGTWNSTVNAEFRVAKGDVCKFATRVVGGTFYFYPMKGAN